MSDAKELFSIIDGKKVDAHLHEPILEGKHPKALAVGRAVAKRLGLSDAAIKRLFPSEE